MPNDSSDCIWTLASQSQEYKLRCISPEVKHRTLINIMAVQPFSFSEALTEFLILVFILWVWIYIPTTFEAISLQLLSCHQEGASKQRLVPGKFMDFAWRVRSKASHGSGKGKCITDHFIIFYPITLFLYQIKLFSQQIIAFTNDYVEKCLLITILIKVTFLKISCQTRGKIPSKGHLGGKGQARNRACTQGQYTRSSKLL